VTYFDQAFRDSMAKFGAAPEPPERYRQERHLFGFFVSGLSAIESFCYGLCALAWEADSRRVSLATPGQKKGVSSESTRDRFSTRISRATPSQLISTRSPTHLSTRIGSICGTHSPIGRRLHGSTRDTSALPRHLSRHRNGGT
jgi:hypothetical protein